MKTIARVMATGALGVLTAAGVLVGAGGATAQQGPSYQGGNCPGGATCTHWCPGDPAIPGSQVLNWDWNVCHDWFWNSGGIVDVTTSTYYPWSGGGPFHVTLPG